MVVMKNTAIVFQYLLNGLAFLGFTNTLIEFDEHNNHYSLRWITGISLISHVIMRVNYVAKIIYLFFLIFGAFPSAVMEFLDNLTVGFWFLIMTLIIISESIWFRKYPFYEILCAGWRIQNEICWNVKKRKVYKRKLQISVLKKAAFQTVIICIGVLAMGVQYASAPKYPIFTGFLVEEDSTRMTVLFGIHDVGFVFTAWGLYGPVICLSSILGGQLHITLQVLTEELENLKESNDNHDNMIINMNEISSSAVSSRHSRGYDTLESILVDYKKLMKYMELLNEFCSYKFLFIHITAYIQMIGDVFIMIQVLRSGEADFMTVFFYLEDCGVCMFMLFRCFKAMSLVGPEAENFMTTLRRHLSRNPFNREHHLKVLRSLKSIALQIGPNFVSSMTVGNAMMVLLNYYIMAALW